MEIKTQEDAKKLILQKTEKIRQDVISWRRHLHMNPELSSQEHKTAQFISEKLREIGVDEIQESFAGTTAVIGLIKGKGNITVALRADTDALPILEQNDNEYTSNVKGVMHACGHDAHTSVLLGAAKVLNDIKEHLNGNVKLIFQPCEERSDCFGASKLVEKNVLENPKVSAIFGLHVFPEIPVGKVGTRKGQLMASSDVFKIVIKGKSTHASRPHLGVDTVLIAAQAINSLHHIVSRKVDPLHPAVITIGMINGGTAENVIPDKVEIKGTVRTLSLALRDEIPKWIEQSLKGVTDSYGGSFEFEYHHGTPPVINDKETTEFAFKCMEELLGAENVVELEHPSMGGEDFGEYLLKVPGTFIRLGVRNDEKGIKHPLHSSKFDIDEYSLKIGVSMMSYLAYKWLYKN
jgi:amidohydrolase